MKLEPIIKSKLQQFKVAYDLVGEPDGVAFERFANQTILTNHQPDAFCIADDLLDCICVGGTNDTGIDGISIKVNGILIRSADDAKDIIERHRQAVIEFIFLQSKYKENFDQGEYLKFTNGVHEFLDTQQYQPSNDKIREWLRIKEYLMSDDVLAKWQQNPSVRLYYVVMGKWNEQPHIIAASNKFRSDISRIGIYGDVKISYIDISMFKKICDDNENFFTSTLEILDSIPLTEVEKVENSLLVLCSAQQLLSMISTGDGMIRKSLFTDNVRDFQGDTTINNEIGKTICEDPQSFVLLNNGITIVCDGITTANRKITIKNPQVVNGCQTCNVIYSAYSEGNDLSKVTVTIKVISTDNDDVSNRIVRGTNRQNIVLDEVFEVTRQFHKDLESFFHVLSGESMNDKIYYERRSKQYTNNPIIKPTQRINLRILIQSFVAVFTGDLHNAYRHEAKLLQLYKDKIFVETQSSYPYYVSALMYVKIENMLRGNKNLQSIRALKAHLAMLIRFLACGKSPSINNEKEIDKYCKELLKVLRDNVRFEKLVWQSRDLLIAIQEEWVAEKGESYRHGMKDNSEFTRFLYSYIEKSMPSSGIELQDYTQEFRGTVIKTGLDRYGYAYGFISRYPSNIFIHSNDNIDIDFSCLNGCDVLYNVVTDPISNREKAVDVCVV